LNQQNKKLENILNSYLHFSKNARLDIVQYLLENKSDLNSQNNFKNTPLTNLFEKREIDFKIVEFILRRNPVVKTFKNLYLVDEQRFLFFLSHTNVKMIVENTVKLDSSLIRMNNDYISGNLWNTTRHKIFPQNVKQNLEYIFQIIQFVSKEMKLDFPIRIFERIFGFYFVSNSNVILYF
jgi:hypothetical protein